MGIVALSVLVFDRTDSALATAALFLGHRLPPGAARAVPRRPGSSGRRRASRCRSSTAARRRPSAAWRCSPTHFSLAAVVVAGAIDGALALTATTLTRAVAAAMLEPSGELRAGNAILNVAFTGGAAIGPALAGLVVAGFGVQSALLLDAVSFYAIAWILLHRRAAAPGRARTGPAARAGPRRPRLHPRATPTLRRLLIAAGRRLRLLRRGDPDRGRSTRRRRSAPATPATACCSPAGASGWCSAASSSPRVRRAPLPRPALLQHARGRRRLPRAWPPRRPWPSPAPPRSLGGAGNGVQWVAVISAVQELTAADDAGAGDERARVDRRGDARRRLSCSAALIATVDEPARDLPRRRHRGVRDRRRRGPAAGQRIGPNSGKSRSRGP